MDHESLTRRRAICRAFLHDSTDNGWRKLQEAIAEDTLRDQGIERLYADRALGVVNENYATDDDVSTDDLSDTRFSAADDGLWVSAWLWVDNRAIGLLPESEEEFTPEFRQALDSLQRPQLLDLLGEGGCGCAFLEEKTDDELRKGVAGFLETGELEPDEITELCTDS